MKNIITYSLIYFIFATSIIITCPHHENKSITCIETQQDLKSLITESQGPIFISFHMENCGWCKKMAPIIDALSQDNQFDAVSFYTANGPELEAATIIKDVLHENIKGYPFMILMNQGNIIDKQIGGTTPDFLKQKLQNLLATMKNPATN